MHLDKAAIAFDGFTYFPAGGRIRCNRSTDGNPSVFGDLAGNKTDALDVNIPVLFGKGQLAGQIVPHDVAVQQGYRTLPHFQKTRIEHFGNGGFSGTGKAGQKNREPLCARRRISLLKFFDNFGKSGPIRYFAAGTDALPDIGAGERNKLRALRYLIGTAEFIFKGQIDHLGKRHDR